MRLRLVLLAFAASVVAPTLAQPAPASGRIPTVTRLVKLFTGLEMDVVAKTHAKDLSALDALLDPSFELRAGNAPGTPVPRDAWIRDVRAASRSPPRIEHNAFEKCVEEAPRIAQMAVHDFGDVAIVSFRETAVAGAPGRSARLVVDCWKRDGAAWKLAVRYVSDASLRSAPATRSPRTLDKRY